MSFCFEVFPHFAALRLAKQRFSGEDLEGGALLILTLKASPFPTFAPDGEGDKQEQDYTLKIKR